MLNSHERYKEKPWLGSSHSWAQNQLNNISSNSKILDIGPGSGVMGKYLLEKNCPQLYAVEIDESTRTHLKPIYQEITDDLSKLSPEKFDVVILLDVLEHMSDPGSFLQELKPRLKSDSRILISVPNILHWSLRLAFLVGYFDYMERGPLDKTHLKFFSWRSLKKFVVAQGFKISSRAGSIVPIELLCNDSIANSTFLTYFAKPRILAAKLFPSLFAYQLLVEIRL